ncbi:unnamed protein product, partial [Nesidiocoris tenuis]
MTWPQFCEIFLARYDYIESPAAVLVNLQNNRPRDGECLAAYAGRLLTTLTSTWHSCSVENIAVSTVMSHLSQFDPRVQRLAFTADINTRDALLRELKALSFCKRLNTSGLAASEIKRPRFNPLPTLARCTHCNRYNHKSEECFYRPDKFKPQPADRHNVQSSSQATSTSLRRPISCFKCGNAGHLAANCKTNSEIPALERRVDFCHVNPTGQLQHNASGDKKDLSPRVHRWWASLQAFDFEIVYRKGSSMKHVDFLSRNLVPSIQPVTTPSPLINEESRAGGNCKRIDLTELPENWLQFEQQRDEEISETLSQMNNGELDEALLQTYEIRSGILFRKIQSNNKTRCLPIVPRALRWSIINNIHEAVLHLGWEKTLEKAYEHYWFEHMSKYVRKFVDNCLTCKIAKPKSGKVQAELHPIPKVCIPWHTIHMDASGKLSGSNETKEYVFVSIDSFTKFVHLHHSFRIDSFNCIQALKASIDLFGAPIRVIADQGRCFASKDFEKFCRTHGIQLHLIATGSSRANGQVERIMSTLKNLLTLVEVKQDQSWQDALGNVQLAMNCTVNRTTKCSPMELMFGKIARPSNMVVATNDDKPIDLAEIRSRALKNIEKNAANEKKRAITQDGRSSVMAVSEKARLQAREAEVEEEEGRPCSRRTLKKESVESFFGSRSRAPFDEFLILKLLNCDFENIPRSVLKRVLIMSEDDP